jgi:intron-binding protein aquarius
MEESAQILEIETLIPILAQDIDAGQTESRLKRVTLIGDHLQLPPIVQHPVLKSVCHLEQSMFTRLIRLGVPFTLLDMQGRARQEIADLYRWRYSTPAVLTKMLSTGQKKHASLQDLPALATSPANLLANAGFVRTLQFVNVNDLQGKGETAPSPFYYQNVAEAEYVVAVFQYMRLLGYPASKISLLTTYNGQKALLKDIVQKRCAGGGAQNHAFFGRPAHIMTVDEFQGRQNDYILLSLVRTQNVGHIRDLRRLTVSLSRARLGLYVFGRESLLNTATEIQPAMQRLLKSGNKLSLIAGESFPTQRLLSDEVDKDKVLEIDDVTAMGVLVYQMVQQAQYLQQMQQMQQQE